MKSGLAMWLAWGVLAVALIALVLNLQTDNNLEPDPAGGSPTQE